MTIRFTAPVFDDDLARQTFLLTMSPVLKATQLFGIVAVRRAEELSEWGRFEASSERTRGIALMYSGYRRTSFTKTASPHWAARPVTPSPTLTRMRSATSLGWPIWKRIRSSCVFSFPISCHPTAR